MASVTKKPDGQRRIQYYDPNGKRKTLHLGKIPQRSAEVVKFKIEQLIAANTTGAALDSETAKWLADRDDAMYGKLAALNLVPSRGKQAIDSLTLDQFVEQLIAKRNQGSSAKGTITNLGQSRRLLKEFFGTDRLLKDITPGQCDDWRTFLEGKGHALATISKHVKRARQFFRAAIRAKLISENPMLGVKAGSQVNKNREYFITREETEKIIAACPDAEWRLIVALGRYGGLRTPSETFALEWKGINWETKRMHVKSPKTARHEGKESRDVPIFPELLPHLQAVWAEAEPGAVHVISKHRASAKNLRTRMERIMKWAGVAPWPRLFQNMRSTRETELVRQYPLHVVTAWIGNSAIIAAKHYLQVTDSDFDKAVSGGSKVACPDLERYTQTLDLGAMNKVDKASLKLVAIAWSDLSEADRKDILAIVRRANAGTGSDHPNPRSKMASKRVAKSDATKVAKSDAAHVGTGEQGRGNATQVIETQEVTPVLA